MTTLRDGKEIVMAPEELAERMQAAFVAEDLELLAPLLHDDVRWGGEEDTAETCHTRADVLAWYRGLLDKGVRARPIESIARPGAVIMGLAVTWPDAAESGPDVVYQVFSVANGQIVDIRGFPDRDEALRSLPEP